MTLLVLAEAVILFMVLYAAALLRFQAEIDVIEQSEGPLWPRAMVYSFLMVLSLGAFGLYSARQRARAVGTVVRVCSAVAVASAVNAVAFYIVPDLWMGRGVLAFAAVAGLVAICAFRVFFARVVDEDILKRRILVYGTGSSALAVANLRRRTDRRGFVLLGFVQPPGEPIAVPFSKLLEASRGLLELCNEAQVDEVIVAMDERRRGFPILDLLQCRLAGIEVTELLTFLERETGRVRIGLLNPSWMIFGDGFRRGPMRLFSARALDLSASLLILAVSLPVMLLTALAIKLEDGWRAPVLYRQTRVGLGGQTFQLLKFRSMRLDAEGDGQARWATQGDARVTRIGRFTRKFRVDELPQVINVFRGNMSFIGPRPERLEFVAELAERIPYYVQRHCVKPGITGWAQLCYPYGASEKDALEKLQYDLYYIKNNSLLFDLAILVQTAEVVFLGQGAR